MCEGLRESFTQQPGKGVEVTKLDEFQMKFDHACRLQLAFASFLKEQQPKTTLVNKEELLKNKHYLIRGNLFTEVSK